MAENPRGGEGSSKGSRYIPERLVGPGVIEQNSYIDRAKAKMHINTVPVCNVSINIGKGDGNVGDTVFTTELPLNASIGGLVRIINANIPSSSNNGIIRIFFNGAQNTNNQTIFGQTSPIFVIPPGSTSISVVHDDTNTANTLTLRAMGIHQNLRIEWTEDN